MKAPRKSLTMFPWSLLVAGLLSLAPQWLRWGFLYAGDQGTPSVEKKNASTGRFHQLTLGNGIEEDGAACSINAWRAPDGQRLITKTIHYDSESRAKQAFEARAKEATKTIDRGPVLNREGQVIGQRVVFEFTIKDQKTESMIMFTDGSKLRQIQSPSLEDALEFEKIANKKSP
jgi:hypothetical protein